MPEGTALMSLPTTIAHYRITTKLGEGGMGEVWRATDTKLGRDVAIKVLPESFSQDPDRLARFEREAKVLAALNHPNIAAIHGLEEGGLVMELVEGPTLAERIAQRYLKPAYVKITPEEKVKVLDFGLAKVLLAESSQTEACATVTMRATTT